MRRGLFAASFLILAIVVSAGFFILSFGAASWAANSQIVIQNNGVIASNSDWIYTGVEQSSAEYLILKQASSTLSSPLIDLNGCQAAQLVYQARTYGGVVSSSAVIAISVFSSGSWQETSLNEPATNALAVQPTIDLSPYCGSQIKLMFSTPGATGNKGVGLDEIVVTETAGNNPPTALATSTKIIAETGEEIEFSDDGSSDPDGDALVDWLWDFGQQLIKHGVNVSQSFSASGTYAVNYYVVDSEGTTSSPAVLNLSITDSVSTSTPTSTPTTTPALGPQIGDLVINEVYPAPNTGEEEWIELFNPTTSTWDLSGLILLNIDGGKFVTTTLSGSISPGQYLVIDDVAGNLNNDGDTIALHLAGQILDQTVYGDYSNKKGEAWARNGNGVFEETITPTKGVANIITPKPITNTSSGGGSSDISYQSNDTAATSSATSTAGIALESYYGKVIINELFPHPSTGANDEFIELKNISTTTVDLNGFYLTDNTNKKHYLRAAPPALLILPQGFIAIKRASTSIALNDTGFETANLFSPLGELLDRVSYTAKQSEGLAYARTDKGEWLWTAQPTPGAENIFPDSGLSQEQTVEVLNTIKAAAVKKATNSSGVIHAVTLEELRDLAVGDKVRVIGVVSVEPGVLGTQIFYLAGSGIQVYCNKKDFPELKIGDQVEVTGEISEVSGERRIKIKTRDDIKYLSSEAEPEPHGISIVELEDNIGSLVRVSGDLLEIKGRNAYIDDGSGEAKVYLKTQIDTKEINWHTGNQVAVVGIASLTASGVRLLPRTVKDITVVSGQVESAYEVGGQSSFVGSPLSYAIAAIVFLATVIGWLGYKLKYK
ncbi:MAG: lamin tail domain-containing protein [Patescibacteria group bacterium]